MEHLRDVPSALVIDDSRMIRGVAHLILKKLGYDVNFACDGDEGLAVLQTNQYDLVLCDIEMPNMDGIELIQKFRKWEAEHRPGEHQNVCCISGCPPQVREIAASAGFDDLKYKPYNAKEIAAYCEGLGLRDENSCKDEVSTVSDLLEQTQLCIS